MTPAKIYSIILPGDEMTTKKWFPEKITATHVRKAAKIWRRDRAFLNFTNSKIYDVVIDGLPYPPKAISSLAYKIATNMSIPSKDFGGARDGVWHKRLKELGFEISMKMTPSQRTTLSSQTAWPFPTGEKQPTKNGTVSEAENKILGSKVRAAKKEELERIARLARIKLIKDQLPQRSKSPVFRFNRSLDVVKERLYIATGICEKCEKKAPFLRLQDSSPYLEVHHVIPLSKGGFDSVENTQALCPNCHSEVHDQLRLDRDDD